MITLFENNNFIVVNYSNPTPHHSRENGGHIVIKPKQTFTHRYEIPLDLATELMHLTMLIGEAATNGLRACGLDIVRINYQDNGNWAYKSDNPDPKLHVHLYIRTSNEKHPTNHPAFQAFPEALVFPPRETGFYDEFKPFNQQECEAIISEIQKLIDSDKYKNSQIQK